MAEVVDAVSILAFLKAMGVAPTQLQRLLGFYFKTEEVRERLVQMKAKWDATPEAKRQQLAAELGAELRREMEARKGERVPLIQTGTGMIRKSPLRRRTPLRRS